MTTQQNRPRFGTHRVAAAGRSVGVHDRALDNRETIPQTVGVVPALGIELRTRNTRPIKPDHAVHLMLSIAAVGLIEPVAVDRHGRLLAGLHRYAACAVLAESDANARRMRAIALLGLSEDAESDRELLDFIGTIDGGAHQRALIETGIPVRRYDLDAEADADTALAIEVAENEIRRDYTAKEVADWHRRLLEAGYTSRIGRPRRWEQSATKALADIVGKSDRTIRRILERQQTPAETAADSDIRSIIRSYDLIMERMSKPAVAVERWFAEVEAVLAAGTLSTAERDSLLAVFAAKLRSAAHTHGHLAAWLHATDTDAIEIEP